MILYFDAKNNTGTGTHDNSVTTWSDLSENGNNGTISGASWNESSLNFGGNAWVNCGQHNPSVLTLEAYVRFSAIGGSSEESNAVVGNWQAGGYGIQQKNGKHAANLNINGTWYHVYGSVPVVGALAHLVVTYDGSVIKFYENGVKVSEANAAGTIKAPTNNTVLSIGSNPNGSSFGVTGLNGSVCVVRLYDRALTSDEVLADYESDYNRYDTTVIYDNVEEIVASVDNAVQLRINTKQDDGTDTVAGVDWFSYGSVVCNSLYANGNSWIGLGKSQEDLKVNRRDCAMWDLWREEGLTRDIKFLRIRWSGYSAYNSTATSALMTYDVILFETGDIMLYMADVPTSNYSGIFTLGDLTYDAPTEDSRYVSFILQADGSYAVQYAPIEFAVKRYLVRNEDILYTVVDGELAEVTGSLNAEMFQTYGLETPPNGSLLLTLSSPQVLCWTDASNPCELTATVQGIPAEAHSVVSDNIRVGHSSIYGMLSVEVTASEGATFFLSFDGGAWMAYTDSAWSVSDIGMTGAELAAISASAWNSVINSAQYMQLKAVLDGVETVTQVVFNFDNESPITHSEESEG